MVMRRTTPILMLTAVMFAVFSAAYVSAQDVQNLAGKWRGWATSTSGSNVTLEVDLKPDGSYTSMWDSTIGTGTVKTERGKLVAEGQLVNGVGTAAFGVGRSELTVMNKDGKQVIVGDGRDNNGSYHFQLMKQ